MAGHGFSLPLLRHRLAEARSGVRPEPPGEPRPEGPLVWTHAGPGAGTDGLRLLLGSLGGRCAHLVTGDPQAAPPGAILGLAPPDRRGAIRDFLGHWRPDVVLWTGDGAHPLLWDALREAGIPVIAADLDVSAHPFALVREVGAFQALFTRETDPRFARARRLGPLATVPSPPPARRDDLNALSDGLATRPVWFACDVPPEELDLVVAAHCAAQHLTHRLLLVIAPSGPSEDAEAAASAWLTGTRMRDTEPGPTTQIFIADEPDETGLWIRLSSVTYLGGSLTGRGPLTPPTLPGTLGSAIVCGRHAGEYTDSVEALHRGGCLLRLDDPADLGAAVEALQTPDRAAEMAHAAWSMTTTGAEATATIRAEIERSLRKLTR